MNSRIFLAAGAVVGAVWTLGCARTVAELTPAPGATRISGTGEGATATVAGVQVVARSKAWHWDPTDLDTKVTPILVEFQNNGDRSVIVRYNHISLMDDAGNRFNVMPPYDIDGTLSEAFTVSNPYYGFNRFAVAPYLSRWYPRFSRYDGAFAYDPAYYRPYYTRYLERRPADARDGASRASGRRDLVGRPSRRLRVLRGVPSRREDPHAQRRHRGRGVRHRARHGADPVHGKLTLASAVAPQRRNGGLTPSRI